MDLKEKLQNKICKEKNRENVFNLSYQIFIISEFKKLENWVKDDSFKATEIVNHYHIFQELIVRMNAERVHSNEYENYINECNKLKRQYMYHIPKDIVKYKKNILSIMDAILLLWYEYKNKENEDEK